jgi:hypothetical protein
MIELYFEFSIEMVNISRQFLEKSPCGADKEGRSEI